MQKIASIALALLLAVASMGVTLHQHYCGGKLKDTSLFSFLDSASCCGDKEMPMDCCQDEEVRIQLDEDYQLDAFSVDWKIDVAAFIPTVVVAILEQVDQKQPHYLNYKPPLIPADIPVLVQTFLI